MIEYISRRLGLSCPFMALCGNYLGSRMVLEGADLDACREPSLYRECGEYRKLLDDREYHQKSLKDAEIFKQADAKDNREGG